MNLVFPALAGKAKFMIQDLTPFLFQHNQQSALVSWPLNKKISGFRLTLSDGGLLRGRSAALPLN
jgi:hypothetical protein